MGEKLVQMSEPLQLKGLEYNNVRIKDSYIQNAFHLELEYLAALDSDRLLAGFMETGGLPAKADRYPGWESTEIQGHTLGHVLTALSQAYGATKDNALLSKIQYLLTELKRCQASDGYLFASPVEWFDRVEHKVPIWVPWYTMHKIMEGLVAAYHYTESDTAYEVMTALGLWIYRRCMSWSEETRSIVLAVEYGGMNDCLYDLYLTTGDLRFAQAAHQFDEIPLFEAMYEQKDILRGLHANTTIPKIVGAAKRYIAIGTTEDFYLKAAENFWELVIKHHTYITGGNSEWEHFGEPDILDDERTACNCETCNTYNMLKLTKLLFRITKKKKYADYYEWAFINTILSSQNPQTGMTTYFQPMATGYFKVYGTPFDRFWCCTGSGMENFTKLTEGIYFTEGSRIYINRFVTSELVAPMLDIALSIDAELLTQEQITITVNRWRTGKPGTEPRTENGIELGTDSGTESGTESGTNPGIESGTVFGMEHRAEIALRIPEWITAKPLVTSANPTIKTQEEQGYLIITGDWEQGLEFTVTLPMALSCHTLPDNDHVIAFSYGPFVLSAGLGKESMDTTITGVDVLVPKKEIDIMDYIVLDQVTISEWQEHIADYLIKTPGKMEFTMENTERDRRLVFTPHFSRYEDRYGIYFALYQKGSTELLHYEETMRLKQELAREQIDRIPIGNDQYELAHRIKGAKTDTARVNGHRCRYAKEDGWFSYELETGKEARKLCVTYCSEDAENQFELYLGDQLFATEAIRKEETLFYTKEYLLPQELSQDNSTVTLKFQNISTAYQCRIYDDLYVSR